MCGQVSGEFEVSEDEDLVCDSDVEDEVFVGQGLDVVAAEAPADWGLAEVELGGGVAVKPVQCDLDERYHAGPF